MQITHFQELNVYQASREQAQRVFLASRAWPMEEQPKFRRQSLRPPSSVLSPPPSAK